MTDNTTEKLDYFLKELYNNYYHKTTIIDGKIEDLINEIENFAKQPDNKRKYYIFKGGNYTKLHNKSLKTIIEHCKNSTISIKQTIGCGYFIEFYVETEDFFVFYNWSTSA